LLGALDKRITLKIAKSKAGKETRTLVQSLIMLALGGGGMALSLKKGSFEAGEDNSSG